MAKGYWVAALTVLDQERYDRYRALNGAAFSKYGAKFLVRGGTQTVAMGRMNDRVVVIEFESYQKALDCYHSPEYQRALAERTAGTVDIDFSIVEGYDGPQPA